MDTHGKYHARDARVLITWYVSRQQMELGGTLVAHTDQQSAWWHTLGPQATRYIYTMRYLRKTTSIPLHFPTMSTGLLTTLDAAFDTRDVEEEYVLITTPWNTLEEIGQLRCNIEELILVN